MKGYIAAICFIISIVGCTQHNDETAKILEKAEQYIEQHPDSSLHILNTLHLKDLSTQRDKAKYALLKSMALDKNYIDVTEDSLTSIALAYYKKHGTPDEKLKAYYYQGRVCINAKDYEAAMDNYLLGEKYADGCKDYVAVGRLYNGKMVVYSEIFNLNEAIVPAKLAISYYLKGKDTVRYVTALNNLAAMYLTLNDYEDIEACFLKIQDLKDYMTYRQKSNYYTNLLNYKRSIKDSTLLSAVEEYIRNLEGKETLIKWHLVADAYLKSGKLEMALWALDKFDDYNKSKENKDTYHFIASDVFKENGDFKKAYEHLSAYYTATSQKDLNIFNSDAKFLEERYKARELSLRHRLYIVMLIMGIIILVMVIYFAIKHYRQLTIAKEKRLQEIEEQKLQLSNQYEKALVEKKRLRSLITKQPLNDDLRRVVEQRLDVLNKFIVAHISGVDMEKSMMELKNYIKNNDEFLRSTKMSLELTHPRFISYLSKQGLSEWEIGCCCLYCIGLNGSEISNYLDIKYFYKNSSAIRKKLGVESINIDTFLQKKAQELY